MHDATNRQDVRSDRGEGSYEAGEHVHEPTESSELRSAFNGCDLVDLRKNHQRADSGKGTLIARTDEAN